MTSETLELPLTETAPVETKEAEPVDAKKWSLAFPNSGKPIFYMDQRYLQLLFIRELDEEMGRLRRRDADALIEAFKKSANFKRLRRLREQLAAAEGKVAELRQEADEADADYVARLSAEGDEGNTLAEFSIETAARRGQLEDAEREQEVLEKAIVEVYRLANAELSTLASKRNLELLAQVHKTEAATREKFNAILDELLIPIDEAKNSWTGFHSIVSSGHFNESILGPVPHVA